MDFYQPHSGGHVLLLVVVVLGNTMVPFQTHTTNFPGPVFLMRLPQPPSHCVMTENGQAASRSQVENQIPSDQPWHSYYKQSKLKPELHKNFLETVYMPTQDIKLQISSVIRISLFAEI